MKAETKHLLIISTQEELIADIKEGLSLDFTVHAVNSLHTGFPAALKLLPDVILIDHTSLPTKNLKNLANFKSTHFLKKSLLLLYADSLEKQNLEQKYGTFVDRIIYNINSTRCLCDEVLEQVSSGKTLSNYWKDAFLGLFNIMDKPVVLLEQENIIAMNDAFKYSFRIQKADDMKLTDLVNPDNKIKVKLNLRTFARGKHMQASTKTTLRMNNDKTRNAKISFSKLDKMIPGQYIMIIDFAEEEAEEILTGSPSLPTPLEDCDQIPRFSFTKREKEIIELLCKGYKTKEISKALFISPKTIEKHRANIIKRTNSETILESIIYAINHNLIDLRVA